MSGCFISAGVMLSLFRLAVEDGYPMVLSCLGERVGLCCDADEGSFPVPTLILRYCLILVMRGCVLAAGRQWLMAVCRSVSRSSVKDLSQ